LEDWVPNCINDLDPLMAAETGLPMAEHWLTSGFPEGKTK
jgi:hypothetical protein